MREWRTTHAARDIVVWIGAAVMAATLGITGCTSTVAGTSVESAVAQHSDGVTLARLDPGRYPITAVPLPDAARANVGVVVEGLRMADAVVVPTEVDGELRRLRPFNTGAVENAEALSRASLLAKHHFVAGFSSSRDTEGGSAPRSSLVNVGMRFPDPATAAAAAGALAAANVTQRRVPIPRHPDAAASAFDMAQGAVVESLTPHGPYLLYQWLQTNKPVVTAIELIAKTLDIQGPRIDRFMPTELPLLAGLPMGPSGLLAHTLPASPQAVSPAFGVYSARAALHFQPDPPESAAIFAATGVESMSFRDTMVFRPKAPPRQRISSSSSLRVKLCRGPR